MSKDSNVVLIIEDENTHRQRYENILHSGGYIPLSATDGYSGLEMLSKNIGIIDTVLLDISLPGLNGLEVLEAIKSHPEKYGDVPVIIVSTVTSQAIVKEALQIGASSYLLKDETNKKEILEELKKCI